MTQLSGPNPIDRRTFWLSVGTSIVASCLFAIFFQPILTVTSNLIVSTIGFFYGGYVDRLYSQAVQSPGDRLIYAVFGIIAGTPIIVLISLGLSNLTRRFTRPTARQTGRLISTVFAVIMIIPLAILIAGPSVSIRANATFQRRLMALTPVISDQERKELLGTWAMINSKAEYENINTQMEDLAKKYHAILPRRSE
jgi:hypothetical protein